MNSKMEKNAEEKRLSRKNVAIALVVIAFFTGIIFMYYTMLCNEKRDNINKSGEMTARKSADQFDKYLSTNVDSIKLSAYTLDGMLREGASDSEIQQFLVGQSTAIRNAVNENSTGLYGYINGKFFSGTNWEPPEGYDATSRPWYRKPLEHPGEMTVLDPYLDIQSGNLMLALGKALADGESVVSVDISLDQIQRLTEEAVSSGGSDSEFIINKAGVVVAHSDEVEIGKNYCIEKGTLGSEIARRVEGMDYGSVSFDYKGLQYVVYIAELLDGWHCVTVEDATNVFSSLQVILVLTIAVVFAIALIISIIMVRSNRRGILAEHVSSQLSSTADIYISVHELDFLSDTFTEVRNSKAEATEIIGNNRNQCQQVIREIMENFSDETTKEDILDFVDFEKLDGRLRNRNTITREYLNKDKEWRKARFIVSGRLADGRISRAMYLVEDIDNEKKERERLINMSQRAIAASEAKSSFLSNMSHEIRTPINAVLGMNEMILRECGDSGIIEYSQSIRTAGNTLLGIVNDILDFSKIEAGKMEIIPVDYDLSLLINDLVNMIESRANKKGLVITLDFDRKIPRFLNGDEIRIKQVITNLLTNAVKYTEKGGVVFQITYKTLAGDSDNILLDVSVKDTGIGIKMEDMCKLFSEFERIEEKRNRNIEGTGLGMNITKSLLEMMGSSLRAESQYGKGSQFSFTLRQRVVRWEPLGDYEESCREAQNSRGKYKEKFTAPDAHVLVVDDNQMNLLVFKGLLKQTMVKIDTALSGDEAIALSLEKTYDLIFLDHMMPEKDGIETLHEMRERCRNTNQDTTVICLTANAITGAREEYIKEGFDDYLTKPVEPQKLEEILLKYLPKETIRSAADEDTAERDLAGQEALGEEEKAALEIVRGIAEIDPAAGLRNNGTVEAYLETLKVYARMVDEHADEIEAFMSAGNIRTATIKIHAMKSTSRIIGAAAIGEMAQRLEDAGKAGDAGLLKEELPKLLERARTVGERLAPLLEEKKAGDGERPPIGAAALEEAYAQLREYAENCDSLGVEEILEKLGTYRLPDEESGRFREILAAVDEFGFDKVCELLGT